MPVEKRNPERNSVTQDNQLIEASYTLTLNEKRLLLLGASKINPLDMPSKDEPLSFEVTAEEWASRFPDDNPWRALRNAAKNMRGRFVTLHPKVGVVDELNWFDSVRYIEAEGRVKIRFGWSVSLRLAGMISEFTRIELTAVQQLRSFHSIRIYELVSQFRSTGYRRISLADFRIAMDCVNTYPDMRELKRRVLMPALTDINEKSDVQVICTDVKKGRKIIGFEFRTKERKQRDLFK